MEVDMAPVALVGHLRGRRARVPPGRREKGLEFTVEIDPELPPSIVSDEQRLGQILKNLLSNAFKFTNQGGVVLAIGSRGGSFSSDTLRTAEDVISFSVTDTGVGIPDDKLSRDLRGLPAGRRDDLAQVRRDRLGPVDLAGDRSVLGGEIHVESTPGTAAGSRSSSADRAAASRARAASPKPMVAEAPGPGTATPPSGS